MDAATQTQFSLIRELAGLLGEAHVRFWLRGGWALDFHAGRATRPHKDVDLVTWTRHRERLRRLLEANGYVTVRFDEPEGTACGAANRSAGSARAPSEMTGRRVGQLAAAAQLSSRSEARRSTSP